MNKFFTKIAALSVGLAMAIGVGVAVGSKEKEVERGFASVSGTAASDITSGKTYAVVYSNIQYYDTGSASRFAQVGSAGSRDDKKGFTITHVSTVNSTKYYSIYSESGERYVGHSSSTNFAFNNTAPTESDGNYLWKIAVSNSTFKFTNKTNNTYGWQQYSSDVRPRTGTPTAFSLYEIEAKSLNHITAAATNSSGWYAGDTFRTSDVTVTPYYSSDDSDPGTAITDGTGVKFGDSANLDSVELSQGTNTIKVNYGEKSVTISVTAAAARTLSSIAVTTAPTKTTYTAGESFDKTGMVVTATYSDASTSDVTNSCTFTPSGALTAGTTSITISCTIKGVTKTTTQAIVVNAVPTTITISGAGSSGTTQWNPTSSGSKFTDSAGNEATLTTDVPTAGWSGSGTPKQFGANDSGTTVKHGTWLLISIPLSSRAGVTAAAVKYCSNGGTTVTSKIYGDTENDMILSTTVTGNTIAEKKTTDDGVNYSTINASTINFKFEFSVGCKIGYVSYTLGGVVQEFSIFTSLAIQNPTSDTQFKEGDTFSASGLILRATDEVGFTKDFTTGFKFGTEQGDDSYTGAPLNTAGSYTVYVTLTLKHPTSGADITKSVSYGITVTEVPTYSLVTDFSSLYEGERVLIVSGTKGASEYGASYLTDANVTFTGDDITDAGDAIEFTVRIYGDKFVLQFGAYYLSYSGSYNQIQRTATLSDDCAFIKDSTGILSNVDGRYLQYGSTLSPSGFACLVDGYSGASHVSLYASDKAPETDALSADTFTYRYLHMRDYIGTEGQPGSGYCKNTGDGAGKNYFTDAATAYASLSSAVKTEFKKNTEAVKRFNAWAAANQKSIDLDTGDVTPVSGSRMIFDSILENSSNATIIIVVISIVSLTAVGGYFLLKKKKEQ